MKSKKLALASVLFATACAANNTKQVHDPAVRQGTRTDPLIGDRPNADGNPDLRRAEVWTEPRTGGAPSDSNRPGRGDPGKAVDNTQINTRDRGGDTLTPMDQGNSESETKISGDIRRAIMNDNTLSFTAQNVKVITVGSKVTLRGPVKTNYEKAAIEAISKRVSGVTTVDNQLEVKP